MFETLGLLIAILWNVFWFIGLPLALIAYLGSQFSNDKY